MSVHIDEKYVMLSQHYLDRFVKKDTYLWNFRCPFCGDSHKNKYKARGYVYRRGDSLFFYCHNCPESGNIKRLLEHINPALAKEYVMESYLDRKSMDSIRFRPEPTGKLNVETNEVEMEIPNTTRISDLPEDHEAVLYLKRRKIPEIFFPKLFFTDDYNKTFQGLIEPVLGHRTQKKVYSDKRIVIPLRNEKNILTGITGRAIEKSDLRYITLKLVKQAPKIYGLDQIDKSKTVYVVEGPFDSMFLNNSIATLDAHLFRVEELDIDPVLVFDNEPRNKFLLNHMEKAISMGMKICLWPEKVSGIKDINNMILSGYSQSEIMKIIDENTYSGLRAKLEFDIWKKM